MKVERSRTLMLLAHMDLLRWSQSAWLEFASVVHEAFVLTPLLPKLLNFKLGRPWSLTQALWAGRGKHCHDPGTSQETLLVDQDSWWRPASLDMVGAGFASLPVGGFPFVCLWLGLLAVLNTFQHQGVTLVSQLALGCSAYAGKHEDVHPQWYSLISL